MALEMADYRGDFLRCHRYFFRQLGHVVFGAWRDGVCDARQPDVSIQTQQKNTSHVVKHFQYVFQQSFFDHHDSRDFVELARPLRLGQACHRVFLCLEPIAV